MVLNVEGKENLASVLDNVEQTEEENKLGNDGDVTTEQEQTETVEDQTASADEEIESEEVEQSAEGSDVNLIENEVIDDFDTDDEDSDEPSEPASEEKEPKVSLKKRIKDRSGGWLIFQKHFWKKVGITTGIVTASAAVIYLAGVAYYSGHFLWGTHIGNFKCSNMTVQEAEEHIRNRIKEYKFTIYEKDGLSETITGNELELQLVKIGDIASYKKAQNPFLWPVTKQAEKNVSGEIEILINEEILAQRVNTLRCVTESIAALPGAASNIYFDEIEKKYKITDDGTRNIISLSMMQEKVKGGIKGLHPDMSLEKDGCYVGLAGDDTIAAYLNTLNTYVATTIDYQRGGEHTLLDGGTIHTWLSTNEDYTVTVNYDAIKQFISDLSALYDTRGATRTIVSSATGQDVQVVGGDYGWKVDQDAEFNQLCSELTTGQPIVREPVYKQTAGVHGACNDLPATYVEVSIAHQKLWFYKDGVLFHSSNVVTGNPYMNNATHTGTYSLKYKMRNAVLRGEDYETPVNFWMPFNGGEGLHDALWRGAFGGSIYRGGGSHGCVNLPYQTAKILFENLPQGAPVVVY